MKQRVGLAGAGWVSQHHLEAWRNIEDAEIIALCDPQRDRAEARATEFGISRVFADAADMLREIPLDALDIASSRETHGYLVRLAAEFGVPAVLCQKPFAPTLAEAEALVRDLAGRPRVMVHDNWRFRPWYRRTKTWLAAGAIGEVRQASIELFTSAMAPDTDGIRPLLIRQPFLAYIDRLMVSEVLIHHLDTARFLFGPLTLRGARLGLPPPYLRGETWASILLATAQGGAVAVAGNLAACGYTAALADEVTILGERGSITLRGGELKLAGTSSELHIFDLIEGYQASYSAAIAHFISCVASGEAFETSVEDNLETLRLVEGVYIAAT